MKWFYKKQVQGDNHSHMTHRQINPSRHQNPILRIWLFRILGLIALLWIGAWIFEFRMNQRQIAFEVMHASGWIKGNTEGFYIDSQGQIYSFTLPQNHFERLIRMNLNQGEAPYTTSDIMKISGYSGRLAGAVDQETLKAMVRLIQPASRGLLTNDNPLTPGSCHSFDTGGYMYLAYSYDDHQKTHTPVFLYSAGDYKGVNTSPEAKKLHQWLENLCMENKYPGCNPPPNICKS